MYFSLSLSFFRFVFHLTAFRSVLLLSMGATRSVLYSAASGCHERLVCCRILGYLLPAIMNCCVHFTMFFDFGGAVDKGLVALLMDWVVTGNPNITHTGTSQYHVVAYGSATGSNYKVNRAQYRGVTSGA